MSLTGRAASDQELRGSLSNSKKISGAISRLSVYHTDAYTLAVKNGFEGTLEEWLESLAATDEQVAAAVEAYMEKHKVSSACIATISLPASAWVGSGNLYSQVVDVPGASENSQVDLTPSVEQLAIFYDKSLAFVTENDDGVVTVYAIGQKPENDYTIQATITEVIV